MSLDISVETEAQLAAKAREQGLSIDAFLKRLLGDVDHPAPAPRTGEAPVLPAWNLGIKGSLHRCDIYDHVD